MKKQIIYSLLVSVSLIVLGVINFYEVINKGRIQDLLFSAILLSSGIRGVVKVLKKDNDFINNKENNNFYVVIFCVGWVLIRFMMPTISSAYKNSDSYQEDYTAQLNVGRPATYYCHIPNDDFNSLYQQLLNNDWKLFFLPSKVIPGNSTVRNVNTYGDNITVEYGDRHNTTVRFIQNRDGAETSDRQFTKLADKEFISETSTEEFEIGNYKVTETTTVISSTADGTETRTVYSYSWNVGKHTHFIETTVDMESKFNSMHTMIGSMHKIEVYDSQEEYEDIMMGQVG
ncbi:MAG: hypothetical protein E7488_07635 [Ruminococcaceae bacterium]|nr:hypothetical protein [Oscillospiraceae bacterium]